MERPVPGLGPRLRAPRRGAAAGAGAGADRAARAGEPRRPELRGAGRGQPARVRAQRGDRRVQPALPRAGDAQPALRLLSAAARAAGRQPVSGVARGQRACLLFVRQDRRRPLHRRRGELERAVGDLRAAGCGRRRRSRGPGAGRRRHPVDGGLEPRPRPAGGHPGSPDRHRLRPVLAGRRPHLGHAAAAGRPLLPGVAGAGDVRRRAAVARQRPGAGGGGADRLSRVGAGHAGAARRERRVAARRRRGGAGRVALRALRPPASCAARTRSRSPRP